MAEIDEQIATVEVYKDLDENVIYEAYTGFSGGEDIVATITGIGQHKVGNRKNSEGRQVYGNYLKLDVNYGLWMAQLEGKLVTEAVCHFDDYSKIISRNVVRNTGSFIEHWKANSHEKTVKELRTMYLGKKIRIRASIFYKVPKVTLNTNADKSAKTGIHLHIDWENEDTINSTQYQRIFSDIAKSNTSAKSN